MALFNFPGNLMLITTDPPSEPPTIDELTFDPNLYPQADVRKTAKRFFDVFKQRWKQDERNRLYSEMAKRYGLDVSLLAALGAQESRMGMELESPARARGELQLMPTTAKDMGITNIDDLEQNIRGGAGYLKRQLDDFRHIDLALAAYNAGPGVLRKALKSAGISAEEYTPKDWQIVSRHLSEETQKFVPSIKIGQVEIERQLRTLGQLPSIKKDEEKPLTGELSLMKPPEETPRPTTDELPIDLPSVTLVQEPYQAGLWKWYYKTPTELTKAPIQADKTPIDALKTQKTDFSQYLKDLETRLAKQERLARGISTAQALWNLGVIARELTAPPTEPYRGYVQMVPTLYDPTYALEAAMRQERIAATRAAEKAAREMGKPELIPAIQAQNIAMAQKEKLPLIETRANIINQQALLQAEIENKNRQIAADTFNKNIQKQIQENMASGLTITEAINALDKVARNYFDTLTNIEKQRLLAKAIEEGKIEGTIKDYIDALYPMPSN